MNYKLFSRLYREAGQYESVDMYVSERGWEEWMDKYLDGGDAGKVVNILHGIYKIEKMDLCEMRKQLGLDNRAEFCRVYNISSSTVQKWEYEDNRLADYFKMLIAYTLFEGER